MKAKIDYQHKHVAVGVPDLINAGWCGFDFARQFPDLVEAGWRLGYYSISNPRFDGTSLNVGGVEEIADLIRRVPPVVCCCCPCHTRA